MQEESKRHMAPIPAPGSKGNGKANNGSTFEKKNVSGPGRWHKVGTITRAGEGVKISVSLFKDEYTWFILRRDLGYIIRDHFPGQVVSITDTGNEVITEGVGRAFRSRSGKALILRTSFYSGDMMTPWKALEGVLAGDTASSPVSVFEVPIPQQERTSALSHTSPGCF